MIAINWWIYLLRCNDNTLYTGIALDPDLRLRKHNAGRGAKYVANRRPAVLIGRAGPYSRTRAARLEAWVKKQAPADKPLVIQQLAEGRIDVDDPEIIK